MFTIILLIFFYTLQQLVFSPIQKQYTLIGKQTISCTFILLHFLNLNNIGVFLLCNKDNEITLSNLLTLSSETYINILFLTVV